MLFERTAVSRKPEKLARKELDAFRADNQWMPDMVFRDPYIQARRQIMDVSMEGLNEIEASLQISAILPL